MKFGCLSFSGIPGPIFSSRTRLLYSDTNLNRIRIAAVGSDISNRHFEENWNPYSAVMKTLYASKEAKENALASEGKSCRPENNNYSQSICMSWPLSVKHAAKITFAQYKCRTFQSIIYPADKNNFIGISSILAWGKSLPPPFNAKVGMFAGKVRCTSRRNKCRSRTHSPLSLWRNNDRPSCSSYKKSETNLRTKRRLDSSALVSWEPAGLFLQDHSHIPRNLEASLE